MRPTVMAGAGLAAAVLALMALQFPNAANALNPQPEVPSKGNPGWHKKSGKSQSGKGSKSQSGKSRKHLPPGLLKR